MHRSFLRRAQSQRDDFLRWLMTSMMPAAVRILQTAERKHQSLRESASYITPFGATENGTL